MMPQPLTRLEALAACEAAKGATLDYTLDPIEAGMGGCPWRIAVTVIARSYARVAIARVVLRKVFSQWPTPLLLAQADHLDHAMIYIDISLGQRRARAIEALSKAWVGEGWENILDLPGCGRDVAAAVERYVRRV